MKYLYFSLALMLALPGDCQNLTQSIRGSVVDADSKIPLPGVSLLVNGGQLGTVTDKSGNFTVAGTPVGRATIEIRCVGYESQVLRNVAVDAGKEVVLDLFMQESAVQLSEVLVKAIPNKGQVQNEMALLSGRSISIDETKRYAGGFNDPAMILSNFAGVTNNGTGSNEVVVRGNSPKYVQWRLEGVEITNPNHFADQNGIGGGISALNNNLLATSDFYTGAFSAEYGDVLSGVYDVKLRNGNNQRFESILGLGIMGADVTMEGPFSRKYKGSYLANYRYSTIGLISDLGLVEIDGGAPTFQDGAFKISLPTRKAGHFALFGLGGKSKIALNNFNPGTAPIPGNETANGALRKDYEKTAYLLNVGLTHTLPVHKNAFLHTVVAFTRNGATERVTESDVIQVLDHDSKWVRDSLANRRVNYQSRMDNDAARLSVTYNNKLNTRHRLQAGVRYAYVSSVYLQSLRNDSTGSRIPLTDFNAGIGTLRSFVNWKFRFGNGFTSVAGVHHTTVLYNKKSAVEPRLALRWQMNGGSTWSAGYGLHSTMERVHNYFAKVGQPGGPLTEPNRDLGLLKAHHFVLGYERRLGENLLAKVDAYWQHLYNLPVENASGSSYATLNEGSAIRYVDLVNAGTGRNVGVELSFERFFAGSYYYLVNTSLYRSTYKAMDGRERNTAYDDRFLVNLLVGKEFVGLGKKKNQTFALNGKVFLGGGKRYVPLLRDGNGNLAVDPNKGQFWDESKVYQNKLDDIYQITFSASYKLNKAKTTHELFLNIDNVTNNRSRISEYFDNSKAGSIGYARQFGMFPNLMYRVYL